MNLKAFPLKKNGQKFKYQIYIDTGNEQDPIVYFSLLSVIHTIDILIIRTCQSQTQTTHYKHTWKQSIRNVLVATKGKQYNE